MAVTRPARIHRPAPRRRSVAGALAAFALLAMAGPASAPAVDDTDVYAGVTDGDRPLLLLADSGAAAELARPGRVPYVAAAWRDRGGCRADRVYWRRGGGPPPRCDSDQWVPTAVVDPMIGLHCPGARAALDGRGWRALRGLRQWSPGQRRWAAPEGGRRDALACSADAGPGVFGRPADGEASPWTLRPAEALAPDASGDVYTLYAAPYVAWWHGAGPAARPYAARQADALAAAAGAWPGPVIVLRHSWNRGGIDDAAAEGGMTVQSAVAGSGGALVPDLGPPGGPSPLTETLFEAAAVLAGDVAPYGLAAQAPPGTPRPSLAVTRRVAEPHRYRAALAARCGRADAVAFAAAAPGADHGARARAGARGLACDGPPEAPCLGALAAALALDAAPLPGRQPASMLWAGPPVVPAGDWLDRVAARAGRRVPDASDSLAATLAALLQRRAGPVTANPQPGLSPPVGLATHGAVLYASYLRPAADDRWDGELRRFTLVRRGAAVEIAEGAEAIVGAGGRPFAATLPAPAARRLYTDVAGPALTAPGNALDAGNARLDAARLGLAGDGVPTDGLAAARVAALARLRGSTTLGAPGAPVVLAHAGGDHTVFVGTGDGLLHAFDAAGRERWAYVPGVLLETVGALHEPTRTGRRLDGVGGALRLQLVDRDGDGRIDPATGERALLHVALRRGGRAYLALDVSRIDAPRHLWTLTPRELPALGETWAAPVPARLAVGGTRQDPDRLVVLLAGGYDPGGRRARSRTRDRVGLGLHLVDAASGARLWSAGPDAAADLFEPALRRALVATPRALDLDDDGALDHAYAVDAGGTLWRFEFTPGRTRDALARVVPAATLGDPAGLRRFHVEPDVARVRARDADWLAVTVASGRSDAPADATSTEAVYSVRERLDASGRLRDPPAPVTPAQLADATVRPAPTTTPGWRREFSTRGEQVLAPALTVARRVHVVTWTPPPQAVAPDCTRPRGTARLHVVELASGRAVDPRAPASVTSTGPEPAPAALLSQGLPGPLAVAALRPEAGCTGDCAMGAVVLAGGEPVPFAWPGRAVRTGWAEREVD